MTATSTRSDDRWRVVFATLDAVSRERALTTGAYASHDQNVVEDRIALAGGGYAVCRSVDDVEQALLGWGVPLRGSLAGRLAA